MMWHSFLISKCKNQFHPPLTWEVWFKLSASPHLTHQEEGEVIKTETASTDLIKIKVNFEKMEEVAGEMVGLALSDISSGDD